MADGPQIDRGAELFARGVGQGSDGSGGAAEQLKPNEHETPELIVQGLNRLFGQSAAKFIDAIPIIGPLLSGPIPTNPGRVSTASGLESDGYASKMINPGKGGTQGSNIYNAIIAPLIANRAISDHTGGTGGSASGDSGGWGGGDTVMTGSGGGGNSFDAFSSIPGVESFISATSNRMELPYSEVSMASLGTFSPPSFGDATAMRGEGFSSGIT
jgi:hypothetical protein